MVRQALALLLAAWLGAALLTVAVVAPGAFAVLPSRTLAGLMVGRVLPVVFGGAVLLGAALLLVWSSARAAALSGAAAAVVALAVLVVVNPRIAALRDAIGGPVDALAVSDPRRALFGQLHGVSVLGLGVAMLALAAALVLLLRTRAAP